MIKATVTNKYGQSLTLTQNRALAVAQITGLTPPPATINTTPIATKDGSLFNSAAVENRNIVFLIYPTGAPEPQRVNLYQFFKLKQDIRLDFETATREVYITGYVESIEGDLYENPQALQISVICPDPYFNAQEEIEASFDTTPEELTNPSDEESGAVFEITASGAASNITITNETTGESFTINEDFLAGDVLTLNTKRGEKSLTLTRGGTTTNILNAMAPSSRWLSIIPGVNALSLTAAAGSENLSATATLRPIFEGI